MGYLSANEHAVAGEVGEAHAFDPLRARGASGPCEGDLGGPHPEGRVQERPVEHHAQGEEEDGYCPKALHDGREGRLEAAAAAPCSARRRAHLLVS